MPERHEPDAGEVNYPYLFEVIDSLGYDGWIGCEYRPAAAHVGRTRLAASRARRGDGALWLLADRCRRAAVARRPRSLQRLVFHRPSAAPVGSTMMLSQPMPMTSVTSFITVAPSALAFLVAAAMSSTST